MIQLMKKYDQPLSIKKAKDGFSAADLLLDFMPDVVFLDIGMPGIDGVEVCRRIKSNPKFNRVKVVMYTGLFEDNLKERSFEAGADEFIKKPITRDKLFQNLSKVIG